MMKNDDADRYTTPQMLETDTMEDSPSGALTTSVPSVGRYANPWPAIRQAVHAYARDPSEEHALAVEVSMRHLRQRRDFAESGFRS